MGKKIDYVFLGSCTNGRIEDFRAFANLVKGHKKANHIIAWLVPGSQAVLRQIKEEGIDLILSEAGFEIRQPGCSACLAMNEDKVPPGKYAVSTSNRNFEGRQGPGARTILAGPLVAAATAITDNRSQKIFITLYDYDKKNRHHNIDMYSSSPRECRYRSNYPSSFSKSRFSGRFRRKPVPRLALR